MKTEDSDLKKHFNFPWIGLSTKIESNFYYAEWTDNSPFDFQAWSKDEPSNTKVSFYNFLNICDIIHIKVMGDVIICGHTLLVILFFLTFFIFCKG